MGMIRKWTIGSRSPPWRGRVALLAKIFLPLVLLLAVPVTAEQPSDFAIYFYLDGQAAQVARQNVLSGRSQEDAATFLNALLAGPTPDEEASGYVSALPPGTELVVVAISGAEVIIDLRLPSAFVREELDLARNDAIIEQMVKTLHPLSLDYVQVRAEDGTGSFVPLSRLVPHPRVAVPSTPLNRDAAPDRLGPTPGQEAREPEYTGQPPIAGQGQPTGALSGKTVWLSAGHGWIWSDTLNRWTTQRGNNYGLVEDFSNAEAVNYYLARYLWNAGADVWLVRERSMTEHEVIVDNDDGAPAYVESGSWVTSQSPGYGGESYRWSTSFGSQSAAATWTPDLPEAGWYAVWAWYRHGTNRAADARYEIHHAGGITPVSISQEVHGQTWRYLGEYYFAAGTAGHVTLVNESRDPGQAVVADAIRFGGGQGTIPEPGSNGSPSGRPRWEEAGKYWALYQGAPLDVDIYDRASRPLYAEWETAKGYPGEAENAAFVSWHTNAGGGSGTVSYIHNAEPSPGSADLQGWVHAELIHDLRAGWDPGWIDMRQRSADFSEVGGLSTIPGVLLEIAFHDSEDPGDADDLREPLFRQIAARAVFQGIVKFFAERDGLAPRLLPEPPTHFVGRNTGPGQVTLSWASPPCCDGVGGEAATSYLVYQGVDGRAFDNGTRSVDPTLTLTGLPPGTLRFFRVTAVNDGGESLPSPVVAVRTPAKGEKPTFLIVDGFDRLDQAAMVPQYEAYFLGTDQRMFLERMNSYDYAVEHGQALDGCGLAFDGAANEAVESGSVSLADYAAVDWFTGEDSVAEAALSDIERALLAAYLDGGGGLLISGAEIGYDLVGRGRDPEFYGNYLRAKYLGDDADTYGFVGMKGKLFEGLAGGLDDGHGHSYGVDYPDRLAPTSGSTQVLKYVGGTADGAAVAYDGDFQVVHFGFPLETVTDPQVRTSLVCGAASQMLPPAPIPEALCTPRLINPGFEGGTGQSAWKVGATDSSLVLSQRDDLPTDVEPHGGDWVARLGGSSPGSVAKAEIRQIVALPSGEGDVKLSLSWLVSSGSATSAGGDTLSIVVYDADGARKAAFPVASGDSPNDAWQTSEYALSAFAGQTVEIAIHAESDATAFFVDDTDLTTCGLQGPDEFRALWVDAYHDGIRSQQQIDELIETARAGNFNALVVQVRRRGDTYYPSAIDPWAPNAMPGFDALAYLIDRAHAASIEVHAWATTLAVWNGDTPPAAPDHAFNLHGPGAHGDDRWLMYSHTGLDMTPEKVYYLDPGHPEVVDYTVAVYAELASGYDLDGLHLDRVRYPGSSWGYNPVSVARFQAHTGRGDTPDPADEQWLQWRRDQVTALMRKVYLTVTAIDPPLRVSVAVSASGTPPHTLESWKASTPYGAHLQDWRAWLEEGILDLALPMTYRDDDAYPEQFDGWIAWQKDHQYDRGLVIGTGLYLNAVQDSMDQWDRARQPSGRGNWSLGLCGYSYATPSDDGTTRRGFANAVVANVFTNPAAAPGIPWKDSPSLGHLAGTLTPNPPCLPSADAQTLKLTGPQSRTLLTDGSGWFGTVGLPPGEYLLMIDSPAPYNVPVAVNAGSVTAQSIEMPTCLIPTDFLYVPLVMKPRVR